MPDYCISNVLVSELQLQQVSIHIQVQLVALEPELIDEHAFSKKLHLRLPGDVVICQEQSQHSQLFRKKKSC
jgi:hypothetical protein